METKAAGINPMLVQRSNVSEVEGIYDALRQLAEDAFPEGDYYGAPEAYRTYQDVTAAIRAVLTLAGRPPSYSIAGAIKGRNISAANSSMRLESRVTEASDDTLAALMRLCHQLEWVWETPRTRREVALRAIPERLRRSRVLGGDTFEFLGWDEDVAREAEGIFSALWCRLYDESGRRAERAESAA